jgi:hypothetical protein
LLDIDQLPRTCPPKKTAYSKQKIDLIKGHRNEKDPRKIERMETHDQNEQIIGKLIKKRKEENEAFIKLLSAIEIKGQAHAASKKKGRSKS